MNYLIIVFVCGAFTVSDTSRQDKNQLDAVISNVLKAYGPHNPVRSILWFDDIGQVESWIDSLPNADQVPDDVTIH